MDECSWKIQSSIPCNSVSKFEGKVDVEGLVGGVVRDTCGEWDSGWTGECGGDGCCGSC